MLLPRGVACSVSGQVHNQLQIKEDFRCCALTQYKNTVFHLNWALHAFFYKQHLAEFLLFENYSTFFMLYIVYCNEIIWLMKMKMEIKNRLHRNDINRPTPRHGDNYIKYKKFFRMKILTWIKQSLSNIWSSIQ